MINYKLVEKYEITDDKIIIEYTSGCKKTITDKALVEYAKKIENGTLKWFFKDLNDYIEYLKEYKKDRYILTVKKLSRILKANNINIIDNYKTTIEGKKGYVYKLSKNIDTMLLIGFKNIRLGTSQCVQAPELKSQIVFIEGIKNNNWLNY